MKTAQQMKMYLTLPDDEESFLDHSFVRLLQSRMRA